MKIPFSALSILALSGLLAACQTLGLPDFSKKDEVPPEVRAEPVIINVPPQNNADPVWPNVATVPFMPKDFSPKPVYDHYMNELEYDRDESKAAGKEMIDAAPVSTIETTTVSAAPLAPPQFQVK